MSSAVDLLQAAQGHLAARASTYDKPQGERSMAQCVELFNTLTGHTLSEPDGWVLMALLKLVRFYSNPETPHRDSIEDGIAYLALMGEAAIADHAHARNLQMADLMLGQAVASPAR